MKRIKTDVLVIGGGSGGLSVAAGASQMGASVTLLEGHKMGGDCLNFGCVPSKALIASGKAAYSQSHALQYGVADHKPKVDYAAAKDHVADVIATIGHSTASSGLKDWALTSSKSTESSFLQPK